MGKSSQKNAEYYLKRLRDLPQLFVHDARTLADEVLSRRILTLSVGQIICTLHLECSKKDYEKDPLKYLGDLVALLEHFGMKTAPCSVPSDLGYDEPVYLTSKPNLACDEDIAAVADIVKQGRAPSAKDYIHIRNTNEKMANYNVILRVIEALFVICRGHLNAQQSSYLDDLLSTLKLPSEGLAYLRSCFTYVSQYRCLSCDYSQEKYCYKALDKEKTERICLYLAKTAALSGTPVAIDPLFPYQDLLHSLYLKEAPSIKKSVTFFDESNSLSTATQTTRRKRAPKARDGAVIPANEERSDFDDALGADELLLAFEKNTFLPKKLIAFLKPYFSRQNVNFLNGLQQISNLNFTSVSGLSGHPNAFFINAKEFKTSVYWPYSPCCADDPLKFLTKSQKGTSYLAWLQRKALGTDLHGVRSNDLNFFYCWNFLAALILMPLKGTISKENLDFAKNALKDTYQNADDEQKLYLERIYALHYLMFVKDQSLLSDDEILLQALGNCNELLNLYLSCRMLECDSTREFSEQNNTLLKIAFFRAFLRPDACRIMALRKLRSKKHLSAVCLKRVLTLINTDCVLKTVNMTVEEPSKKTASIQVKCLPLFLCSHVFLKALLTALLNNQNLSAISGIKITFQGPDCIKSASGKILLSHLTEIIYLSTLHSCSHDTLASLLADNCPKKDLEMIRAQLAGKKYRGLADLQRQTRFCASENEDALLCLEEGIKKCGLLSSPLEWLLPPLLRKEFSEFTLVEFPVASLTDETFMQKLGAAQLAIITVRTVFPNAQDAAYLASVACPDDPAGKRSCEIFLKIVEDQARLIKPFTDFVFKRLYESVRSDDMFALYGNYLKSLIKQARYSVFANYASKRYERVLEFMHLRINTTSETKNNASVKPSAPTFNQELIQSKIKESREVESVISLLREDEDPQDVSAKPIEQQAAPLPVKSNLEQPETLSAEAPLKNSDNNSGLSANALSLIEAVSAQKTDVMGMDEFNGLCLSLGFMSGDAAVEELNDYCYEHFDEAMFDSAPEDDAVYITLDLLSNF